MTRATKSTGTQSSSQSVSIAMRLATQPWISAAIRSDGLDSPVAASPEISAGRSTVTGTPRAAACFSRASATHLLRA